jgi:hypothetical protein
MHTGIGAGSPFVSPTQTQPFGLSPYGLQNQGAAPWGLSPYGQQQPIQQWLQTVPQQLQQLQQVSYAQQQLLQQLVQVLPQQIQQLQQIVQYIPQQLQQLLQLAIQQQFAGGIGQGSQALSPFHTLSPFGAPFTGSSGHVM